MSLENKKSVGYDSPELAEYIETEKLLMVTKGAGEIKEAVTFLCQYLSLVHPEHQDFSQIEGIAHQLQQINQSLVSFVQTRRPTTGFME